MKRFNIWFGGIFAAFGLVFAGVGSWFWFSDLDLAANGERAQGRVVGFEESYSSDNGTTYRPRVSFTDANGQLHTFTGSIGSSPPSFDRGEEVEVIYDPWTPEQALIDSFGQRYLFPLAFGGFGLVFAGIGFGMMGWGIRRRMIIDRLKLSGVPIEADFGQAYLDTSVKVNGRSPWRVTAQATHPFTGKLETFKSERIWANPSGLLSGKKVRVLVDPNNPKRHYIDLDEYLGESASG